MSAHVVLKITTILKEMRIAQLCSKSEWTLDTKTCRRKLFLHNEQKALYYKKLSVLRFFFNLRKTLFSFQKLVLWTNAAYSQ